LSSLRRGKEIFSAIEHILLEQRNATLRESPLFREVNDRLKKSKGKGISHRDFKKVLELSIKEGRLGRHSEKKVKPVYYFLTESHSREFQRYDFVEIDQEKNRQRKLRQLLLLYESCRGTLKIRLRTKGRTRFSVEDLPGFTPREILRYPEEQAGYASVPWFHPSWIFTHMKFEMNEIDRAVRTLERDRSIEPFCSLPKPNYLNDGQPHEVRYRITNKLRGLMRLVWSLYLERLSIVETKYHAGIIDNNDKIWLSYLLGRNKEKLMQEWKERPSYKSINEEAIEIEDGQLVLAIGGRIRLAEKEFKEKVEGLLKSYLPVLTEYDLPESFVQTILLS
jgi:hypothetical protein